MSSKDNIDIIAKRGLQGYFVDPQSDMFGYWMCTLCGFSFYDGPRASHDLTCKDSRMPKGYYDETYQNCIRVRNKPPNAMYVKTTTPTEWHEKCNKFEFFR
jgi:hypothetical protein